MNLTRKELFILDWILKDKLKDLRYIQNNSLHEYDENELIEIESDIENVSDLLEKVQKEI